MAHMVKCVICREQFDLESVQGVRYSSTRYAHQKCCDDPSKELIPLKTKESKVKVEKTANKTNDKPKSEYRMLTDYIQKVFGDNVNWGWTAKMIEEYRSINKYTYTGILNALTWWYEVKGRPPHKANGKISIVPFIYAEAQKYYKQLEEAKKNNAGKQVKDTIRTIIIAPPYAKRTTIKRWLEDDE